MNIVSVTYLYSEPPYLLEGASQGSHPEPVFESLHDFLFSHMQHSWYDSAV